MFQVGVAAPCRLLGEPPFVLLCLPPFIFSNGKAAIVANVTINRREGNMLCFLKINDVFLPTAFLWLWTAEVDKASCRWHLSGTF